MNAQPYQPEVPGEPGTAPPAQQGVPLPLARPRVTYVLLALLALVFGLELITGGYESRNIVPLVGEQINLYLAQGQYWRLFTPMFIHYGVPHFLFNAWALYIFGQEVERYYGPLRFTLIFFLSGLAGNILYYVTYVSLSAVPSAGASGAIFGLVGADIAYFIRNRQALGSLSRQQLSNLVILVAINLVFGFIPGSGINYLAHIGGLICGLLLGLGLAPHWKVVWDGMSPRVVSDTSLAQQLFSVLAVSVILFGGQWLGDQRWAAFLQQVPGQPQASAPAAHVLNSEIKF